MKRLILIAFSLAFVSAQPIAQPQTAPRTADRTALIRSMLDTYCITDTTSLTTRIARASTMSNREGQTTLFFLVQSGRAAAVRFLLDHGASVDATLLDAARDNAEIAAMIRAAATAPLTR